MSEEGKPSNKNTHFILIVASTEFSMYIACDIQKFKINIGSNQTGRTQWREQSGRHLYAVHVFFVSVCCLYISLALFSVYEFYISILWALFHTHTWIHAYIRTQQYGSLFTYTKILLFSLSSITCSFHNKTRSHIFKYIHKKWNLQQREYMHWC